jgi:hypothetical protein
VTTRSTVRPKNAFEYRFLMWLAFPALLFAVTASRLAPRTWLRADVKPTHTDRSVFGEAWAAAGTVAQLAFAG